MEFFCVGTELTFASTRKDYWVNEIIPAVKKVFQGHIMYAANWNEYTGVEFWGAVDYIGIDAYFPLSKKDNPSPEEVKEGWKKWVGEIEAVQRKFSKPVVFTESGYCSADSAARTPWEEAVSGKPNTELQAVCYQALFETFWNKPWFCGVYWWNWNTSTSSGGSANRRFTPQNKLALEYVKMWYGQKNVGDMEVAARMKVQETLLADKSVAENMKVTFTNAMASTEKSLKPTDRE